MPISGRVEDPVPYTNVNGTRIQTSTEKKKNRIRIQPKPGLWSDPVKTCLIVSEQNRMPIEIRAFLNKKLIQVIVVLNILNIFDPGPTKTPWTHNPTLSCAIDSFTYGCDVPSIIEDDGGMGGLLHRLGKLPALILKQFLVNLYQRTLKRSISNMCQICML